MRGHLLYHSVHAALAALYLGITLESTIAGSFTHGCAARDLQILRIIEERESTNALSVETLSEAMLTILNARMICHEGHVVDALAIYDEVSRSVTPGNFRQSPSPSLTTSE